MSSIVVGVADCQVSKTFEDVLVTYALGSCMAVAIHDPAARVAGLLHFMLPDSAIDRGKAQANPYLFADTGIPLLFHRAYAQGAEKRRLVVRIAGGAQLMNDQGAFNIGKRNYVALRRIFSKAGVPIYGEDVGGSTSRTVRLEVATGRFLLCGPGGTELELGPAAANFPGGP